jgi:probable HAF family extracellular repeat protein
MSETAATDPYTGWPSDHAVMFKNGQVLNLGTLPGGYQSQANDINDFGQVSGFASNGTPDPYSFFGWGTQARSFIWHNGVMRDIGTLGGPDTVSTTLNARGQITGQSYTNSTVNPATGIPALDPFLWQHGHMRDLGTLGGTAGFANWLNNAGDVVGASDLAGDQTFHPFLWNGTKLIDLGTLGGANGSANWVNAAGAVAGNADVPDGTHHAFLWNNGHLRELPPVGNAPCSSGQAVNNRDEVVGNNSDCQGNLLTAVLWRDGHGYDLNTLIAPSRLHLTEAAYINDRANRCRWRASQRRPARCPADPQPLSAAAGGSPFASTGSPRPNHPGRAHTRPALQRPPRSRGRQARCVPLEAVTGKTTRLNRAGAELAGEAVPGLLLARFPRLLAEPATSHPPAPPRGHSISFAGPHGPDLRPWTSAGGRRITNSDRLPRIIRANGQRAITSPLCCPVSSGCRGFLRTGRRVPSSAAGSVRLNQGAT